MADNETVADIIAEMRRRSDEAYKGSFNYAECQENQIEYDEASEWADRFEAAHRRERGDCVKLREALKLCLRGMCEYCRMDAEARGMTTECVNGCKALRKAKAALSAPPRNCDVYTADELKAIFKSELASELPIANEHEKNLVTITATGVIDTLLAPATEKEGGGR